MRGLTGALALVVAVSLAAPRAHADSATAPLSALPSEALPKPPPPATDGKRKLTSVLAVGGVYLAATSWVFVRYYFARERNDTFAWHNDGWFAADTYAGGADKLGHMWGNYALTRGVAQILISGGWDPLASDLTAASLAASFYLWSEITDGYYGWGFSTTDMVFNLVGNGLGILVRRWRALDDLVDLRISYFPSEDYRDEVSRLGFTGAGEDYTGQATILAFHLKAIPGLSDTRGLAWTRYFDLTLGYRTIEYLPRGDNPRQRVFFGVSLNLQHLLRNWDTAGGEVARFAAEIYAPPLTAFDLVGVEN
jgi:hypothetical protein